MIIKSMSRKQATFGQLVDYMEDGRQDIKFTLKHNLYSNKAEKIKEEFEENAKFVKKRKNGVYMYHEVLSITKSKTLSEEQQKERLREVALNYLDKRAKNNLAYAVLHDDKKDNLHYHFLISSNEVQEISKHRLSKEEFDTIKKDLEKMVLEKYPELEQKELINKQAKEKISNKGAELKRRTGNTNQRDSVKDRLSKAFSSTVDKQSFFDNLAKENLEVYIRGNTIGIVDKDTGRKHRLKSLGLDDDFQKISNIVEGIEKNKEKVDDIMKKGDKDEDKKQEYKVYKEKISVKSKTDQKTEQEKENTQQPKTGNYETENSTVTAESVENNHPENVLNSIDEIIEKRKQEMKQERAQKDHTEKNNSNTKKR